MRRPPHDMRHLRTLRSRLKPDVARKSARHRRTTVRNQTITLLAAAYLSDTLLNLSALPMTLTDDSAMAAAAMTGDSKMPNGG